MRGPSKIDRLHRLGIGCKLMSENQLEYRLSTCSHQRVSLLCNDDQQWEIRRGQWRKRWPTAPPDDDDGQDWPANGRAGSIQQHSHTRTRDFAIRGAVNEQISLAPHYRRRQTRSIFGDTGMRGRSDGRTAGAPYSWIRLLWLNRTAIILRCLPLRGFAHFTRYDLCSLPYL